MKAETARAKRKLKNIETVRYFEDLLNRMMISEEERKILTLIYKEQKTISYIADALGMSEANVKRKHHKLLMKVGKIL